LMRIVNQLLDVPSIDPEDARRRKLLNILLIGIGTITLLILLATSVANIIGLVNQDEAALLVYGCLVTLIGISIIYVINRYWSGWLASLLFLLLLTVIVAFSDEPQQVVNGRALFLFAIPVLTASVLLRPWVSFIMTGLIDLMISVIALRIQFVPPVPTMLGFFAVALVAWLAARSLEQALEDLRTINRELDQRVEERTQELAEALGKNQAVLESITDGVVVFDNDGLAIVANPAVATLLGRPADEILGSDIKMLMSKDVSLSDQGTVTDLLRDKGKRCPSVKIEWGDKILSVSVAPVRDDSGRVIGTVVVFRDFTREAEVERMKRAFVSTVSHELRTPLNAILGYADMLREAVYGPLSDLQLDTIERIIVNSKRQLNIVNDLLDQAQIEAGRMTLSVTSFSAADLVDDVQGVMGVLAQKIGLELTSHVADDVPATLSGDRQRLHQILINLVGNAIKFTDKGSVHVRVYRPNADHWALAVSDTGCGVPPEAQSYVFDPFRQVDSSVTREYTGSGLGLSIVKQLTTLMDGEVTLTSEVGQGSTFTIVLPLIPT